jgi:hypothetical protein
MSVAQVCLAAWSLMCLIPAALTASRQYRDKTARPNWLRIRDNATSLSFEHSVNGIDWFPVFTESTRTTFLTASVYGWGGNNNTGSSGTVRLSSRSIT